MSKVFLCVTAEHDRNGQIRPVSITWQDGRVFTVDRVFDVRPAWALKVGGQGLRYHCRISGKEVYLFCDDGLWFLEMV